MKRFYVLLACLLSLGAQPACHAIEGFTLFRPWGHAGRGAHGRSFIGKANAAQKSQTVKERFQKGKLLEKTRQKKVILGKTGQQRYKTIAKVRPSKVSLASERRPNMRKQIKNARPAYMTR